MLNLKKKCIYKKKKKLTQYRQEFKRNYAKEAHTHNACKKEKANTQYRQGFKRDYAKEAHTHTLYRLTGVMGNVA